MLGQYAHELSIATRGRAFYEITREVDAHVDAAGFKTGLVTLHVRHTSASLLIQENADPSVRTDLESIFSRLAPDADPVYEHNYEGDDDMAAHVRTALTNVNISIPISGVPWFLALGKASTSGNTAPTRTPAAFTSTSPENKLLTPQPAVGSIGAWRTLFLFSVVLSS